MHQQGAGACFIIIGILYCPDFPQFELRYALVGLKVLWKGVEGHEATSELRQQRRLRRCLHWYYSSLLVLDVVCEFFLDPRRVSPDVAAKGAVAMRLHGERLELEVIALFEAEQAHGVAVAGQGRPHFGEEAVHERQIIHAVRHQHEANAR